MDAGWRICRIEKISHIIFFAFFKKKYIIAKIILYMSENIQPTSGQGATPLRAKTPNDSLLKKVIVHPITEFDEVKFLDLLEHSLSLSTFEKKRVIDSISQLSQFQIDELMKVFEDERVEFRKLVATEGEIIKWLVVKAQNEWEQLKDIYLEEDRAAEQARIDAQKAEEIKKNMGL